MLGIFPQEEAGRMGLSKVKVTPLLYLQLRESLESGRRITHKGEPLLFNLSQLQMAFSHYLRETKGPWKEDQVRKLSGLDKLAEDYVGKQQEKFDAARSKDQKSGMAPKAAEKKEYALLRKFGLLPDEKDMPDQVEISGLSQQQGEEHTFRNMLRAENIVELMMMIGEPAATAAFGVIVIAMQRELVDKVCEGLIKTYEDNAHNAPEKEILTSVLGKVMGDEQRIKYHEKISTLQNRETDAPHQESLHKLRAPHAHDNEKLLAFKDNTDMTQKPVYAKPSSTAPVKARTPFDAPVLPSVPRPDFTDPAFGGSGKRDHKDA